MIGVANILPTRTPCYARAVDVERTIEFILESQAKAEIRMDKIDKRLDGISKLLLQGMRMLIRTDAQVGQLRKEFVRAQKATDARFAELAQSQKEIAQSQKEIAQSHRELAQAQKATERSLKAFIDSMRHGRNGNNGR